MNLSSWGAAQHRRGAAQSKRAPFRSTLSTAYSLGAALVAALIRAMSRDSVLGCAAPAPRPPPAPPLRSGNDGIACRSCVSAGSKVIPMISAAGRRSRISWMTAAMMASSPRFLVPTWPRMPMRVGSRSLAISLRQGDHAVSEPGSLFQGGQPALGDQQTQRLVHLSRVHEVQNPRAPHGEDGGGPQHA